MFRSESRGTHTFLIGAILGFLFYKVAVKLFWLALIIIEWAAKWTKVILVMLYNWITKQWQAYQFKKHRAG